MEKIDDLNCKGLKIIRDTNFYNFTIDPILLVNLSSVKKDSVVVDLCSGGGIIPILVAGKSRAKFVYGIELQKELSELANKSVIMNNQTDKVCIINDDIKNYKKYFKNDSVDVVYCNPPYSMVESSFKCNNLSRAIARQELNVTLQDCITIAKSLLKYGGEFYMVHQIKRLQEILALLYENKLALKNLYVIRAKEKDSPHLVVIKAIKGGGYECNLVNEIVINNDDGTLSDFVQKLYAKQQI